MCSEDVVPLLPEAAEQVDEPSLTWPSVAAQAGVSGEDVTRAADEKANPVGAWKIEYAIGDQQRTATLTITKDGEKLAGTMDWPDQKDAKLKDVKSKDGELTFSAVRADSMIINPRI